MAEPKENGYEMKSGLFTEKQAEIEKAPKVPEQVSQAPAKEEPPIYEEDCWKKSRREFVESMIADAEKNRCFPWESGRLNDFPLQLQKSMRITETVNRPRERKGMGPEAMVDPFYHGGNQFRLMAAAFVKGYNDSRWATFDQIKALGGYVRRGEKGTPIEWWSKKTFRAYTTDENGRKVPIQDFNEKTGEFEDRKKEFMVCRIYYVFNYAQCQGLPFPPEQELKQRDIPPETLNKAMENMLANSEAKVVFDQKKKNFYSPGADEIHLMPKELFVSNEHFYGTAAHEMGHSTGAEGRLNRDGILNPHPFGTEGYAREELVADLTSAFLQMKYGIATEEGLENHKAYLLGWDQKLKFMKDHKDEFFKVIQDADKAAAYIQTRMIEKNLSREEIQALNGFDDKATEVFRQEEKEKSLAKEAKKRESMRSGTVKRSTRKKIVWNIKVNKKKEEKGMSR